MPLSASDTAGPSTAGPSYQPFQCVVCLKRFTRHENLKRHAALHIQSEHNISFPCDICSTTFARQDLRRRHVKYKHPELAASQYPPAEPAVVGPSRSKRVRAARSSPTSSTSPRPATVQQQAPQDQSVSDSLDFDMAVQSYMFDQTAVKAVDALDAVDAVDPVATLPTSLWGATSENDSAFQFCNDSAGRPSNADSNPSGELFAQARLAKAQNANIESSQIFNATPLLAASWEDVLRPGGSSVVAHQQGSIPPRVNQYNQRTSPEGSMEVQDDWFPSRTQITHGIDLFFFHVAHFLPFLHKPSFNPSVAADHLVLSMACLGYQYGDDPDADGQDESGYKLSLQCFHAARELVVKNEDSATDSTHKLVIVQAYLLLQVYAMMYLGGEDCLDVLRMHSKMIGLSRSSGLMQSLPTNPTSTSDLESLWREFIKAESHKRTMLALHHIDALWYQILSVPRLISHLEIKHDMPCYDSLWTISSASEWAHRTLTASRSSPPIRYLDAIRNFLSPLPDSGNTPQLESLGALNVIHFLQSSLREVSGWSAMTGRVSPERFEALIASLTATEPYIRSRAQSACEAQCVVVEATWEMAMLETLLWSPSHMAGIVEVSLAAALATAACLATSRSCNVEADLLPSLHARIDWFLLYLEKTVVPDREPPFVTVYAFKAFLVAWQLVRDNAPNAMTAVGISDGDSEAALAWAIKVFKRRQRWKVGKLVLRNLVSLPPSTGSR